MDLKFQVQLKIQRPVAEVFDGVVNPGKLSGYFVQKSSGPLREGTTVQWTFAEVPGDHDIVVRRVVVNEKIVFEWAAAEGAFWPMHAGLFERQKPLSDRSVLELARERGLRPSSLEPAWSAHTFIPSVKEDFLGGIKSGVRGTPSFFINGVRYVGPTIVESLTEALQQALRRASDSRT